MPFSHRNKELLGGGTAIRVFGYRSTDSMLQTIEPDYFRNWSELDVGDWVKVACPDGTFEAVVKSNSPKVIGPPDNPFQVKAEIDDGDINALRAKAKERGINTWGMSKDAILEALKAA